MSESRYLVTARKYRPTLFRELVAQEHVTKTLKNAFQLDRLAHAYLFSGPRGIGKTTAARILAKAINCMTPPGERLDATEPCRTCQSCLDFEQGRSMSIFEIDAASNNKVEDIRELRETVRIPPQGSRKKVYIIDEVHMLSNAAFNALLKTLEEPPPHVLFIFATTEPHKVLPTILSRCQRFDFRRIPVASIIPHLQRICEEENVTADEDALILLARKGDGALRDALSAFDQAVALCGSTLRYASLAEALRVVDIDLFFETTRHVTDRSMPGMLQLVEHVVRTGFDLQEFLVGLAEHLRNLLVACTMREGSLIEAAEATRQRYVQEGAGFTETQLLRMLMIADDAEATIVASAHPRQKLELALLKMVSLSSAVNINEALDQIRRLQEKAGGSAPSGDLPSSSPVPSGRDVVQVPAISATGQASLSPARKPVAAAPTPPVVDSTFVPTHDVAESASVSLTMDTLETHWSSAVRSIMEKKIHVGSMLQEARVLQVSNNDIKLAVPSNFHARCLAAEENYLQSQLRTMTGAAVGRVHFVVQENLEPTVDGDQVSRVDAGEYMRRQRQESPVIKELFDVFEAELIW